jgi:hypothetical protein
MEKYFGLRSKVYSHNIFENGKEDKKAKGVKKNIIQKEICFEDFRKCLLTKEPTYKKQNMFRTQRHDIYTVEKNIKALSASDDKRFILEYGMNTLAWGITKLS